MAQAIPKGKWSEAEEYCERAIYWDFLVQNWLSPETAVMAGSEGYTLAPFAPTNMRALADYGWLMEPATSLEQ